jgi:hypothetical protein
MEVFISMRSKVPIGMILQHIAEEGDTSGLSVLVGETVHLPKARDFASSTAMMARAFKLNKVLGDDESLMLHAHKLASMGKRVCKDRENLKPLVESARAALAEWTDWVEAEEPTEDEIQEHLERVAGTMASLYEALSAYDSFVLAKLKEDRGMD